VQGRRAVTAERPPFRLGCVINPVAGLGGSVGLKGSDGADVQARARALGGTPRAPVRVAELLGALRDAPLRVVAPRPPLGPSPDGTGLPVEPVGPDAWPQATGAGDTEAAVGHVLDAGVDLLLFAGGDGTARDVHRALRARGALDRPVLGLPAGVKMHSGVFAVGVGAAAELLRELAAGGVPEAVLAEVRDLDEDAVRSDRVVTRHFGDLLVPASPLSVQQVKDGAGVNPAEQTADIAAYVAETLDPAGPWAFGPGSTVAAIQQALGLPATLLGFDLVVDGQPVVRDASRAELEAHADGLRVVLTPTGGQGHLLGRGNQQLGPSVLRRMRSEDLWVVATPAKLAGLRGRPLWVDLDDAAEAGRWAGLRSVITGYEQRTLWRLAAV
jgi:predicted polyphosphate/ATP-dependent NAD kinase